MQAPTSFEPDIKRLGWIEPYDLAALENAPRFINAGYEFVQASGCPLTLKVLDDLLQYPEAQELITDKDLECRVTLGIHCLNIGEYPAAPGWRAELVPGVDDYPDPYLAKEEPYKKARVIRVILSDDPGGVSVPVFCANKLQYVPGDHNTLWNDLNVALAAKEAEDPVQPRLLLDREVVMYSNSTLVRESAAHARGWRFDLRLMFNQFDTVACNYQIWTSQVYVTPKIMAVTSVIPANQA